MFRKLFVPALAVAMLSGCVTDYSYRDGRGDYYYGRPQVEYRVIGGYGYGGYGGYGNGSGWYGGYGYGSAYGRPVYYYDRFGRLVYGYPYGGYGYGGYGAPYSGGYRQHRPHPPQGGGVPVQPLQPGTDANGDANDNDRQPIWRNYRDMRPVTRGGDPDPREDNRPRRLPSPFMQSTPRPERVIAPAASMGVGEPLMGAPSARRTRRVSPAPTAEE